MDYLDSALAALGLDPHRRYGPNHGAPLSVWAGFGLTVVLALGTLTFTACVG